MELKTIVKTINNMLKAKFLDIHRQSTDIQEGFKRPSFFVTTDSNKSGQQNDRITNKKVGIRIYYFPSNEHNCQIELLEMQDSLDELFSNGFMIQEGEDKTYINLDEDGIDFNTTDNVLQALFYVNYMNETDPDADYDYMEKLNLNL